MKQENQEIQFEENINFPLHDVLPRDWYQSLFIQFSWCFVGCVLLIFEEHTCYIDECKYKYILMCLLYFWYQIELIDLVINLQSQNIFVFINISQFEKIITQCVVKLLYSRNNRAVVAFKSQHLLMSHDAVNIGYNKIPSPDTNDRRQVKSN